MVGDAIETETRNARGARENMGSLADLIEGIQMIAVQEVEGRARGVIRTGSKTFVLDELHRIGPTMNVDVGHDRVNQQEIVDEDVRHLPRAYLHVNVNVVESGVLGTNLLPVGNSHNPARPVPLNKTKIHVHFHTLDRVAHPLRPRKPR